MKISSITLTVLQFPGNTSLFSLEEQGIGVDRRWIPRSQGQADEHIHLLRVQTNDGVEVICTVGDARYTQLRRAELEQLRLLCLGESS